MAVLPLESLPLGFRFRPTDEELVSHYLKRKITGEIRGEREVIPEIDVCKCEPWDLPDKSLIRSDDPEWFFFAPKDRKYPNGSRSNRATEKGYWKATGKDRIIKSKAPPRHQQVIGMKKTLVFHKGRAPKGERTFWIMHEYRTTEPQFDSGDQGGYVLYKLFRKSDDSSLLPKSSSDETTPTNLDEIDRSGYSPAPSRSSPDADVIQADADVIEEITAPSQTVNLQKGPRKFQNHGSVPVGTGQNQVQDLRSQFFNPNNNNINTNIKEENNVNVSQDLDINDFLNSAIPSANDVLPHQLSDFPYNNNNKYDDPFFLDGINFDDMLNNFCEETDDQNNNNNNNMSLSNYENALPLPYDYSDTDVVSYENASPDTFQDLFTSLEETSAQNHFINNSFINNSNTNNNEGTGIMIRPRQHVMTSAFGQNRDTGIGIRPRRINNNIDDNNSSMGGQGEASRRVFLQTKFKIGTCLPCQNQDEEKLEESNNSDVESAESIVIDKLEELSLHDEDEDSEKNEEIEDEKEEIEDKNEEIEDEKEAEIKTLISAGKVIKKRALFSYFTISVMIVLIAILCSLSYNNNMNVLNYI